MLVTSRLAAQQADVLRILEPTLVGPDYYRRTRQPRRTTATEVALTVDLSNRMPEFGRREMSLSPEPRRTVGSICTPADPCNTVATACNRRLRMRVGARLINFDQIQLLQGRRSAAA